MGDNTQIINPPQTPSNIELIFIEGNIIFIITMNPIKLRSHTNQVKKSVKEVVNSNPYV